MMCWFVGCTKAGLGGWAEKNITEQGYETYTPRIVGADGKSSENLFSRYLLVHCGDHMENYRRLNSTRGMKKLLPVHLEEPIPLPRGYVDELRQRMGLLSTLETAEEVTKEFLPGQEVEITLGPYAGMKGTFQERKKGLARLVMFAIGGQTVVHVPLQNIA